MPHSYTYTTFRVARISFSFLWLMSVSAAPASWQALSDISTDSTKRAAQGQSLALVQRWSRLPADLLAHPLLKNGVDVNPRSQVLKAGSRDVLISLGLQPTDLFTASSTCQYGRPASAPAPYTPAAPLYMGPLRHPWRARALGFRPVPRGMSRAGTPPAGSC